MAHRQRGAPRQIQFPEGIAKVVQEHEPIMVSVRQKQLVERGNPSFWHPQWEEAYETLTSCRFQLKELGDFIPQDGGITYGQVGRRIYPPQGTKVILRNTPFLTQLRLPDNKRVNGVAYIQVRNLTRTGIDLYASPPEKRYIEEGSHNDPTRSRVEKGNLLIVRSGEGSIGRCIAVTYDPGRMNVDQHISKVRLDHLQAEFVAIFLQSQYGAKQIERMCAGVSGQVELDFDEFRSLLAPILEGRLLREIASAYDYIVFFHNQSMQIKAINNVTDAEHNLYIAKGMLETLIWQVEKLIEGEREGITPLLPEEAPEKFRNALIEEYRRVGELHQRLEKERRHGRILGIPTERYPEVAKEIDRILRFVEATLPEEEG